VWGRGVSTSVFTRPTPEVVVIENVGNLSFGIVCVAFQLVFFSQNVRHWVIVEKVVFVGDSVAKEVQRKSIRIPVLRRMCFTA
jgi:hypothetical protein